MNRIRIAELERSIRMVREVIIGMTDEELARTSEILQNAGFAVALETYSRVQENQKVQEPALV